LSKKSSEDNAISVCLYFSFIISVLKMFALLVVSSSKNASASLSYLGGAGVEGGQGSNDYNYGNSISCLAFCDPILFLSSDDYVQLANCS